MLKKALKMTFDFELEKEDYIEFEHNYSDENIVDVVIIDHRTGDKYIFDAYDLKRHCFPY